MVNSIREYRYLYAFPRGKKSTKHFVNLVNMQVTMRHSVSHCARRNTGCITNYMSAIILSSSLNPPPPTLPLSPLFPSPPPHFVAHSQLFSFQLISSATLVFNMKNEDKYHVVSPKYGGKIARTLQSENCTLFTGLYKSAILLKTNSDMCKNCTT